MYVRAITDLFIHLSVCLLQLRKTKNPFTYDVTASKVKSAVTGVNFASKNGSKIPMKDTTEPIEITIENEAPDIKTENMTMSVQPDGSQENFHKIDIHNESFRAVLELPKDVRFQVYLRENKRPTTDKYAMKWNLPDNSSCKWKNESQHRYEYVDLLESDEDEYECSRNPYIVFTSDSHGFDGVFYLGESLCLRKNINYTVKLYFSFVFNSKHTTFFYQI